MVFSKLYNLQSFQRQYKSILILSASSNIPNLNWEYKREELLSQIDWNNILGIASALCQSAENEHIDASLRIAQTCILTNDCSDIQKSAAAYILECLTNRPAISMAVERNILTNEYSNSFSIGQKLTVNKTLFENSIIQCDKDVINLNKFQKDVYEKYKHNDAISISAPTSAGKSFVLCKILLEELLSSTKNIIYLVPTRALISQVEKDLRELISTNDIRERVVVSTVPPLYTDIDRDKSNVYVFTQERLHWFISNNNNNIPAIDLIIVDEAHKIEDGNRGILLQQKIEELLSLCPNMKIYFSSPFTSNPEILLENTPDNARKDIVNTRFIAVNQNLIYATPVKGKPKVWKLSLVTVDDANIIGTITLSDRPTRELHRMSFIAKAITSEKKSTIIYSNGPADAETLSLQLFDMLDNTKEVQNDIVELIKLVKHSIHPSYALGKVLEKGVAYHYGNMPLLIREEIERLFSLGQIKYLVCTSTLLEGVNLPAKSIVIRKPLRGRNNPLNSNDFWNLAGRAGRWGKEFSGNIICIEPENWTVQPSPNKTKQQIKRAVDIVEQHGEELIQYIDSYPTNNKKNRIYESAFSYFYIKHVIDDVAMPEKNFYNELAPKLEEVLQQVNVPDYIVKRNPGVSPLAQQKLLDYFYQSRYEDEEFVPVYPNDNNAYEEYVKLIDIIGNVLSIYPPQLNRSRAILLISWMTGKPLSFIIKKSFRSYKNSGSTKSLSTVIREVMENIETFARYEFSKDSSCYIDILRYYLETKGRSDLIENIPQLSMWLEFGVSATTHLSLLTLGLSRSTVIELGNKYITNTNMTIEACVEWLKNQDLNMLDISPIMVEDIRKITS